MVDRGSPVHLYNQIAGEVRDLIAAGELRPGMPVPSETVLRERYDVSRPTIQRAMRILRDEGLVYSEKGKGTFVGPPDAPQGGRKLPRYKEIAADVIGQIKAGRLKEDRRIPSEKTLMQAHGVAGGTARQAVAHLRELGWVVTIPQKGTFVVPRAEWPKG
ncbi:GntR family transcriptional regulator [Acrocarpospora sp. B8E8]|uniref:GntR family transcriptional regulator n=1 Tax=Acrocarpospora sp. B8E8 TaxID=3153572 RepID=UPI00325DFD4B